MVQKPLSRRPGSAGEAAEDLDEDWGGLCWSVSGGAGGKLGGLSGLEASGGSVCCSGIWDVMAGGAAGRGGMLVGRWDRPQGEVSGGRLSLAACWER